MPMLRCSSTKTGEETKNGCLFSGKGFLTFSPNSPALYLLCLDRRMRVGEGENVEVSIRRAPKGGKEGINLAGCQVKRGSA